TEHDTTELGPLLARLRIELGVRSTPSTKAGWQQRLEDCNKAVAWPSGWVNACRVECLAEMGDRSAIDEALATLRKRNPTAAAEPFVLYAEARAAAAQRQPERAADLLERASVTRGSADVLSAPHRRLQRANIVRAAVQSLREGATLDKPFR